MLASSALFIEALLLDYKFHDAGPSQYAAAVHVQSLGQARIMICAPRCRLHFEVLTNTNVRNYIAEDLLRKIASLA
jgi:hypothetical protein